MTVEGGTPHTNQQGYDPAFFRQLLAIEDRHFWFRSRNQLISLLVERIARSWQRSYRVLEVGCGNGNVLRHLVRVCRGGSVFGMDLFAEGLRHARERAMCPVVQASAGLIPFRGSFDLVGMFDVLEHIPDDIKVLRELYTLLAPGGVLLLTVPAGKALWSYFDELSQHCRRYEAPELAGKLQKAGFELTLITHYMAVIYPLVRLIRLLLKPIRKAQKAAPDSSLALRQEFTIVPVFNALLTLVLRAEASWISRGRRLPFGTSLIVIAKRPGPVAWSREGDERTLETQ